MHRKEQLVPPVRIPPAVIQELGQLVAELGLDLVELSARLGIRLYPPSREDAEILWQRLHHVRLQPVEGLTSQERAGLANYLQRFMEIFDREKQIQCRQRFAAFLQQPDRYGTLAIGAVFPRVEFTAFEHGLNLADLSARMKINLCNLTRKEVHTLRQRALSRWDEVLAYVREAELPGLDTFLQQYEQAYEQQMQDLKKKCR